MSRGFIVEYAKVILLVHSYEAKHVVELVVSASLAASLFALGTCVNRRFVSPRSAEGHFVDQDRITAPGDV